MSKIIHKNNRMMEGKVWIYSCLFILLTIFLIVGYYKYIVFRSVTSKIFGVSLGLTFIPYLAIFKALLDIVYGNADSKRKQVVYFIGKVISLSSFAVLCLSVVIGNLID